VAAIDLFVPLSLDLFGRAFEAGDRQPPVSLISSFNREIHGSCGSCCGDLGHGWRLSTGRPSYPRLRGARPDCWRGDADRKPLARYCVTLGRARSWLAPSSLLDAVGDACDSCATAYRDLIPRWTYSTRSALVFARPVRVVKRELGHVVVCTVLSGSGYRLRSTRRISEFTRDSSLLSKFGIALAEACTAGARDGWRTGSREQSNGDIAFVARQARGMPNGVCKTGRGIDRPECPILAPVGLMNATGQREGSP